MLLKVTVTLLCCRYCIPRWCLQCQKKMCVSWGQRTKFGLHHRSWAGTQVSSKCIYRVIRTRLHFCVAVVNCNNTTCRRITEGLPSIVSLGACPNIVRHTYKHVGATKSVFILSCYNDILAKWTRLLHYFHFIYYITSLFINRKKGRRSNSTEREVNRRRVKVIQAGR